KRIQMPELPSASHPLCLHSTPKFRATSSIRVDNGRYHALCNDEYTSQPEVPSAMHAPDERRLIAVPSTLSWCQLIRVPTARYNCEPHPVKPLLNIISVIGHRRARELFNLSPHPSYLLYTISAVRPFIRAFKRRDSPFAVIAVV